MDEKDGFFKKMINKIKEFVGQLGKKNLIIIGVSALLVILVIIILVVSIPGGNNKNLIVKGTVSSNNPTLSKNGVGLTINEIAIEGVHKAEIRKIDNLPKLDGVTLNAYDFSIEDVTKIEAGVIELTIPLQLSNGQTPGAAYYNEEDEVWEPVFFIYDNNTVTIITDHLSTYGVFATEGFGQYAKARYTYPSLYGKADNYELKDATKILNDLAADYSYSALINEWAFDTTSTAFGLFDAGVGLFLPECVVQLSSIDLDIVGNGMVAFSVATAMIKMYQASKSGDSDSYRSAVMSLASTSASIMVGQLIGTTASAAAFAAAGLIDYSLSQLQQQQISGVQDKYYKAYQAYYSTNGTHYRSLPKWFNLLYEGALIRTPDEWDKWVKEEIDSYINKFWNDTSGDAEILLNEYGINHGSDFAERTVKVSEEFRYLLYRQFNECDMWQRIADKVMVEMVAKTDKKNYEMEKVFNKIIQIQYKTDNGCDGMKAIISGSKGDFIFTTLSSNSNINDRFTLWAYLLADQPCFVEIHDSKDEILYATVLNKLSIDTIEQIVIPNLSENAVSAWLDASVHKIFYLKDNEEGGFVTIIGMRVDVNLSNGAAEFISFTVSYTLTRTSFSSNGYVSAFEHVSNVPGAYSYLGTTSRSYNSMLRNSNGSFWFVVYDIAPGTVATITVRNGSSLNSPVIGVYTITAPGD